MKKLIKSFLAMVLASGCLTFIPVNNVNADTKINGILLDRSNWSGTAYDASGNLRESEGKINVTGNVNDFDMEQGMFDGSFTSMYHSGTNENWETAKLPLYMIIDLNALESFDGFSLYNREANAITEYDLYYNANNDTSLVLNAEAIGSDAGAKWVSDNWTKITGSDEKGNLQNNCVNNVTFNKTITTKQLLLVVKGTNSVNNGSSFVACRNFELFKTNSKTVSLVDKLNRDKWTGMAFSSLGRDEEGANKEGAVAYMFDDETETSRFHVKYTGVNKKDRSLPVYIFMDLNDTETFGAISWKTRNTNDAAKYVDVYVNDGDNAQYPTSDRTQGYTAVPEGWKLVGSNTLNAFTRKKDAYSDLTELKDYTTNYLYLNETVTANKVLVVIKETYDGVSNTDASCEDFNLWTTSSDHQTLLRPDGWDVNTYRSDNWSASSNYNGDANPSSYLIDTSEKTVWHSKYNSANTAEKFSVVIKFNGMETFNKLKWVNMGTDVTGTLNGIDVYTMTNASATDEQLKDLANWTLAYSNANIENSEDFTCMFTTQNATYLRLDVKGNQGYASAKELYLYDENTRQDFNIADVDNANDVLKESYYDAQLNPITTSENATILRTYAKSLLDVKAQAKTSDSETGMDVRFVASVPSLNLSKVGFEVTINGKTTNLMSSTVFDTIATVEANGDIKTTYFQDAAKVYNNISSKYFFTYTLKDVPLTGEDETEINVRAFWISNGGVVPTIEDGALVGDTKDVQYGNVRTFTVQELKAGIVK